VNTWGFNIGFGGEFWFNDHVALSMEAKYFWADDVEVKIDDAQWQQAKLNFDEVPLNVDFSHIQVNAGMKFFL
jgi:hypothetical protein